MITTEDINLSKMSYTNKDFASIYPEVVSLAQSISNRWDPQLSNESDPGIVLLKTTAGVADSLMYNIDKNTLESFLPSAAQDKSARNIVEINGYTPRYYVAASGDVTFSYNPTEDSQFNGISIPKFTITLTSDNDDVTYTQVAPLTLSTIGMVEKCKFMEGYLETLTINNSETILLENIDQNNRLYLQTTNVAQNGIFITLVGDTAEWTKTDYLLTWPTGSKVYKVDYDSDKNLPYIEFPSDIANIIGNGLNIKYIVTSGSYGNVKAKYLTKISSPTQIKISDSYSINTSDITVANMSSILNGKDPETINEMYQSFKKIVGTFDTLVTTQDYTNYIYKLEDEYNTPFISNDYVTDIRNDYNHASDVVTFDQYGVHFVNVGLNAGITKFNFVVPPDTGYTPAIGDIKFVDATTPAHFEVCVSTTPVKWEIIKQLSYTEFESAIEAMTPFDLYLYLMKPFSMSNYKSSDINYAIRSSFEQALESTAGTIIDKLSYSKCLAHNIKLPSGKDVLWVLNTLPLEVKITTYSRVNSTQQAEILTNIYKALTENFNARMVDFGEELDYDEVSKIIKNSDENIKSIYMSDFKYIPYAELADGSEIKLDTSSGGTITGSACITDMIAKNVLAGRLCLFNFDTRFDYEFGQKAASVGTPATTIQPIYENVNHISTSLTIPKERLEGTITPTGGYVLKKNEFITFISPNYTTIDNYSTYVKYTYTSTSITPPTTVVANQTYKLEGSEKLTLTYTESGTQKDIIYTAGTLICPNFELTATSEVVTMSANQSIDIKKLLRTDLGYATTYCYWIVNRPDGVLFDENPYGTDQEKILESNEYFIFTNPTKTELLLFGPGTKLIRPGGIKEKWAIDNAAAISVISSEGLNADIKWKSFDLSVYPLQIYEMSLVTLGEDDWIATSTTLGNDLTNSWQTYTNPIFYKLSTESDITTDPETAGREIRSRFDLNLGPATEQILVKDTSANKVTQSIKIEYLDSSGSTPSKTLSSDDFAYHIQASSDLSLIGGDNVNISIYTSNNIILNFLVTDFEDPTYTYPAYTQFTGTMVAGTRYYYWNNEKGEYSWIECPASTSHSDVITSLNNLGTIWYTKLNVSTSEKLTPSDDKYIVQLKVPGTLSFPTFVRSIPSSVSTSSGTVADADYDGLTYIYPIYVSGTEGKQISIKLTGDAGEIPISEYNSGLVTTGTQALNITQDGMYLISCKPTGTIEWLNATLTVTCSQVGAQEVLTFYRPLSIFSTSPFGSISVDDVAARMKAIVDNSNKPNTKIYYINKPESSIAIQHTDVFDALGVLNPEFVWDKNNVVNHITIPMITLDNIGFAKSSMEVE